MADHRSSVKIKVSSKLRSAEKGNSEFENITVLQELGGEHTVKALTNSILLNSVHSCVYFSDMALVEEDKFNKQSIE